MIQAITTVGWVLICGSVLALLGCLLMWVIVIAAGRADENLDRNMLDRRAQEAEFDLEDKDPPEFHK